MRKENQGSEIAFWLVAKWMVDGGWVLRWLVDCGIKIKMIFYEIIQIKSGRFWLTKRI